MRYLLVSKKTNGFSIDEISEDLESLYQDMEYQDVANGEYQIWTLPDGKIYDVIAKNKIAHDGLFATPYNSGGSKWTPELKYSKDVADLIRKAFSKFSKV